MKTLADAVAQLQGAEAGGFDFTQAQAVTLLQEGVKRLASVSGWIQAELELGPTVAGQEEYELPANVVQLRDLAVNGFPFERHDIRVLWDVKLGRRSLVRGGEGGIYAERFSSDGKASLISIWLPPSEDGLPIVGMGTIVPDDLELTDTLPFPVEFNRAVLDYAKGIAYEDIDENPTSGNYFLSRADQRANALRMLNNSRTGAQPFKIPVAGHRR